MSIYELYSYRRCPYAIRARIAMHYAQISYRLHEISLKVKPLHMLEISPKGTVPVLWSKENKDFIIDESLEIMKWALTQSDLDKWLDKDNSIRDYNLVLKNDTEFKKSLDRFKYPTRHPNEDVSHAKENVEKFFFLLEECLKDKENLCSDKISFEDIAIFPFIRQASNVDISWFLSLQTPNLRKWLERHTNSSLFETIFDKNYQGFDCS